MEHKKLNRRRFITGTTTGIATIPLVSILGSRTWAAERISESHGTAVALGYKHDGKDVDTAKYPTFKPEQRCDNCIQYVATADDWGTCNVIPGFEVAGPGWCQVWVKQP